MPEKEETTRDLIVHLKRKVPFSPFEIVMSSGDRYVIEEQDALALATSQVHYYPKSGLGIHLRLHQIVAVEEPEEKRKRRKAS